MFPRVHYVRYASSSGMGSLTCALRDGRLSFIAGGDVANAITPAETSTAPPQSDAPARGASALARTVAESTIALNRIVVSTRLSRTLDDATTRAHGGSRGRRELHW